MRIAVFWAFGRNYCVSVFPDNGRIYHGSGKKKRRPQAQISTNPFEPGELPASFKNLTHLAILNACCCNLVGAFPSYLTKMQQLEELYLRDNSLTGAIPPGIWDLKNLQILQVQRNNLTGNVVIDGFAALRLTVIDLAHNKLTGTIPEVFGRLKNLTYLVLYRNNFSGEIPMSITNCAVLEVLYLGDNKLSGEIPKGLCVGNKL